MSKVIFDLTRTDWIYKGILFAEVDNAAIDKEFNCPFPAPKNFVVGVLGIIYVDEKGIWHGKMRLKFPSGNKQICTRDYDKEFKKNVKVNETYVLNDLYKIPMINTAWYVNPDGSPAGMLKILEETDMIESIKYHTRKK